MSTPEEQARETIDAKLAESGWIVQSRDEINLSAGPGVAIREFPLQHGSGYADYLLFVNGAAVGALEAKPEGHTLRGVEIQADKYTSGLAYDLNSPVAPLPFRYVSTGKETIFWNHLDPTPRSRDIFQYHRPETLRDESLEDNANLLDPDILAAEIIEDLQTMSDELAQTSEVKQRADDATT